MSGIEPEGTSNRLAPPLVVGGLVLLAVFAYTWNVEVMALWGDEAIRGLVSLEMLLTGEYIVPHKGGEYYYDKPPLYNWFLSQVFRFTGRYDEWIIRLPGLAGFALMALTIYAVGRREISRRAGLFGAFAYLAGIRILSYDSMLGHIDPLYSWLTFGSFLVIYYGRKHERWWLLFTVSWLLCAVGYLLKAMPSLLFQVLTLVVWLYDVRHLRWLRRFGLRRVAAGRPGPVLKMAWRGLHRLICWPNAVGVLLFLIPVGGYFYLYSEAHSLRLYILNLWDQSAQRTVSQHSAWDTVLHLLTFPLDVLAQLAPFSLLLVPGLRRSSLLLIHGSPFLRFCLVVLLVNLPAYWLSPGTYPRYLFMLYPLVLLLIAAAGFAAYSTGSPWVRRVEGLLLGVVAVLGVAYWFPVVAPEFQTAGWVAVAIGCTVLHAGLLGLWWRTAIDRWLLVAGVLFVLRLLFDFHAIPHRAVNSPEGRSKAAGLRVVELSGSEPVASYAWTPVNDYTRYYISSRKQQVMPRIETAQPDYWLIVDENLLYQVGRQPVDSFRIRSHESMFYVCPPIRTPGKQP